MGTPGNTGPGLLADIEQLERDVQLAQRAIDETTGTAEAGDELVEATVTGRGELTRLVLDARVYREFAPDDLAEEIVTAVNEARTKAQQNAVDALNAALPTMPPVGDDPAFGPLLTGSDTMRAAPRSTGGR
ncbi:MULTISPECIES: YbaB/EbfC family nucleoid-associated protein [unclassified Kribbella]|uniref:YbaB/EbfC family nucleoid-associated protein n=1 Tax=unclassified Kribbella TaxID=2644121 RepID=UPI003016893A